MRGKYPILLWLTVGTFSPILQAEPSIVAPWELIAIPMDYSSVSEKVLNKIQVRIAEENFEQSKPFDKYIETAKENALINEKRFAKKFLIEPDSSGRMIQPILCQLEDKAYFSLMEIQLKTGLIAGIQMGEISYQNLKEGNLGPLQSQLEDYVKAWKSSAAQTPQASPLKLGLTLKKASLTTSPGQLLCANLRVAQTLIKSYKVLNFIGHNNYAFIRNILTLPSPQRANRALHLNWVKQNKDSWDLQIESSESIFGSQTSGAKSWVLDLNQPKIFEFPPEIAQFLESEERGLSPSDLPQIVKIYGAWAYLDKGRGWGLKVNDRMIGTNNPANKGHIVGFFGPGKGLMSSKGYPIQEGAILYVRKGQHEVTLGDSFTFDPKTYPTPWPPQPKN